MTSAGGCPHNPCLLIKRITQVTVTRTRRAILAAGLAAEVRSDARPDRHEPGRAIDAGLIRRGRLVRLRDRLIGLLRRKP